MILSTGFGDSYLIGIIKNESEIRKEGYMRIQNICTLTIHSVKDKSAEISAMLSPMENNTINYQLNDITYWGLADKWVKDVYYAALEILDNPPKFEPIDGISK